jgi:hypothetical protein
VSDLLRGLLYAFLTDIAFLGLLWVLHAGGLIWAPALVWAMAALVITGIAIAEERYLIAGGFWLLQLGVFTLFLAGFVKLLTFLPPATGR